MVAFIAGAIFLYCVVIIARDDWVFRIVPDRFLVLLFLTGAVYEYLNPDFATDRTLDVVSRLAYRSAILGLLGLAAALFYRLLRGREGLGMGDVKLMAAAGVWLPVLQSFHAITAASVAAFVAVIAAGVWRGKKFALTQSLPFAAFLAPAFWLLWILQGFEPLWP
jgi:leader peptidase (prepilin peptidase) / N-methyltransferase